MERSEDGTFAPGNQVARNRGQNKVSTKVKESIVAFLERNVDTIQASFDKLKDKEKLEFISNILPYAAPKLSAVQMEGELNGHWKVTMNINGGGNRVYQAVGSGLPEAHNGLSGEVHSNGSQH